LPSPTKDIWFWEHRVPDGQKAYSMTKPIRFEHLQGCIDWWGGPKRKGREEGQLALESHGRGGEGARLQSRRFCAWRATTGATAQRCSCRSPGTRTVTLPVPVK
jgi:hypothetical protein